MQPELNEVRHEPRLWRRDAEVGDQGQSQSGTDRRALHRRDHRRRHAEQPRRRHVEGAALARWQRLCDRVGMDQIGARAEYPTLGSKQDRTNRRVRIRNVERIRQLRNGSQPEVIIWRIS